MDSSLNLWEESAGKILGLKSMFPFLKFASTFAFDFQLSELFLLPWAFLGGGV